MSFQHLNVNLAPHLLHVPIFSANLMHKAGMIERLATFYEQRISPCDPGSCCTTLLCTMTDTESLHMCNYLAPCRPTQAVSCESQLRAGCKEDMTSRSRYMKGPWSFMLPTIQNVLQGVHFGDLYKYFPDAIVLGISDKDTGKSVLNPDPCTVIGPDDNLVLMRPSAIPTAVYQPLRTAMHADLGRHLRIFSVGLTSIKCPSSKFQDPDTTFSRCHAWQRAASMLTFMQRAPRRTGQHA